MSTIKDIAQVTGYSLSTISKYINGGSVKPQYAERIEQAIKTLNYRPNYIAKGMRNGESFTVGVLMPCLDNIFSMKIISELEFELEKYGYSIILCDCRNDIEIERRKIAFLRAKQVDGLIIIPCSNSALHIKEEVNGAVPVVFVDRVCADYPTDAVITNNAEISERATEELLEGSDRVAIITSSGVYTADERLRGFRSAYNKKAVALRNEYVKLGGNTVNGGYNAMIDLFSLSDKPKALFITNYEMTIGAVMAANKLGIRIGEDIAVIAFDNMELTRVIHSALTTITQPIEELGKAAAQLIVQRIKTPLGIQAPHKIVFDAMLTRQSEQT